MYWGYVSKDVEKSIGPSLQENKVDDFLTDNRPFSFFKKDLEV
jgi:hypothetical protein